MKLKNLGKLGNRLLHSIIVTAVIIFIIILLSVISIRVFLNVNIKGQRSLDFIDEAATQMYQAIIDQEIGQRGYLLTNDEIYLQSYYDGLERFSNNTEVLYQESRKFPLLIHKTEDFIEQGKSFRDYYVKYHINLVKNGNHPTKEELLKSELELEEFRQLYNDYYILVEEQRADVRNAMRFRINFVLISIVVAISLIIAINVIVNINILRKVIRPIIDLSNSVKSYTEHDFTKNVPDYEKRDELYDLIRNVDIMRNELSSNIQSLKQMVNIDALTGLYNRRYFSQHLEEQWKWAKNNSQSVSLILLDIDHYKLFNDTYGHLAGDDCLKKIAKYLSSFNEPPLNFVSRYGGEEFCLLLISRSQDEVVRISEKIREDVLNLKIPHETSPTHKYVTVSIGIASIFPNKETTSQQLILLADRALYCSKNNGRNLVTVFNEIEQQKQLNGE